MKERKISKLHLGSLGDFSGLRDLGSRARTFTDTPLIQESCRHVVRRSAPRADIVVHPRYVAVDQRTPRQIDSYRLLAKIGEGGMGEVYEAEQRQPVRRRVALKLLKYNLNSREISARFETERQALALMNHSGIAGVYDAGTTEHGRPYFVMEFVSGLPITRSCDQYTLDIRRRLELFVEVCGAVQHAHHRGVIHRDLKPSNILVVESEGQFLPKIIDFGIAKAITHSLTDQTLHTELGRFIGTPEYMSPEQAGSGLVDIDTRADVYSLGVILYELLTGEKPYDIRTARQQGLEAIRRHLYESHFELPSSRFVTVRENAIDRAQVRGTHPANLKRQLQGDLDSILQKALEKDRSRRYGSPSALAADLVRYLDNRPVSARPTSVRYRLSKCLRRHRTLVLSVCSIVLALFAGGSLAFWGLSIAHQKNDLLERVVAHQGAWFEMTHLGEVWQGERPQKELIEQWAGKVDQIGDLAVQAEYQVYLGRIYHARGQYDLAIRVLNEALESRQQAFGFGHPKVAESLVEKARLEIDLADYKTAREATVQALKIFRDSDQPDPRAIARAVLVLAEADMGIGLWASARHGIDIALKLIERELAGDPLLIAEAWVLRGRLRGELDPYVGTEDLRRSLAVRQQHLKNTHPAIGWSRWYLAQNALARQEHDEADTHLWEALSVFEKVYGEQHPVIGRALVLAAHLELEQRRMRLAWQNLERASQIFASAYSKVHPDLAAYQSVHGFWLLLSNRFIEAEAALEVHVKIHEALHGPRHFGVAQALQALGRFKTGQGDYEGAASALERAYRITEAVAGSDSVRTASAVLELAHLAVATGGLESARDHYQRVLEVKEKYFGQDHIELAVPLEALAALVFREGDAEGSLYLERRALIIREQTLGSGHPTIASNYSRMGALAGLRGDDGKMVAYHRRALEILEAAKDPSDPRVGSLLAGVALALLRQGSDEEVLPLLARAERIAAESISSNFDSANLVYNLACIEVQRGRFSAALRLLRRYVEFGFVDSWIAEDPDLRPLHDLPEFQVLLEEVTRHLE